HDLRVRRGDQGSARLAVDLHSLPALRPRQPGAQGERSGESGRADRLPPPGYRLAVLPMLVRRDHQPVARLRGNLEVLRPLRPHPHDHLTAGTKKTVVFVPHAIWVTKTTVFFVPRDALGDLVDGVVELLADR